MKLDLLQAFLDNLKEAYTKDGFEPSEVDILFSNGDGGFDITEYKAMVDGDGKLPPRTVFRLEPYEDEEVE